MKQKIKRELNRKVPGLSLFEVLIAIAAMGAITGVIYYAARPAINEMNLVEARTMLGTIAQQQQVEQIRSGKYSREINVLMEVDPGQKFDYQVVEATATTFKVRATAKVDYDNDGVLATLEVDQTKEVKVISQD